MELVLDNPTSESAGTAAGTVKGVRPAPALDPGRSLQADRDARADLRRQIARLERALAEAFATAFPRSELDVSVPAAGGPRLLGLADLERLRDDLHARLSQARAELGRRGVAEERNRVLLERMLLEPRRYKFVRIANADLGEGGCGEWQVRPRLGLIGMLAGWWQVKLSSGCPLAEGRRPTPPRRESRP